MAILRRRFVTIPFIFVRDLHTTFRYSSKEIRNKREPGTKSDCPMQSSKSRHELLRNTFVLDSPGFLSTNFPQKRGLSRSCYVTCSPILRWPYVRSWTSAFARTRRVFFSPLWRHKCFESGTSHFAVMAILVPTEMTNAGKSSWKLASIFLGTSSRCKLLNLCPDLKTKWLVPLAGKYMSSKVKYSHETSPMSIEQIDEIIIIIIQSGAKYTTDAKLSIFFSLKTWFLFCKL